MQKIFSCTLPNFRLRKISLILAITLMASPLVAMGNHWWDSRGDHSYIGDTYFNKSGFVYSVVQNAMAPYWYFKNKRKNRSIRSFCYFDPNVEKTIGCSWRTGSSANSKAKKRAKERCKDFGGSKCVQFWANGKLKYKKTPEADAKKFIAIFENIGLQDYDTGPLVEGKIASERSREGYQYEIELFEKWDVPHFVVCGTGEFWISSSATSVKLKHVRNMCVLSCQTFQDFYDRDEGCFVYSEDGNFVSPEAERIFTN